MTRATPYDRKLRRKAFRMRVRRKPRRQIASELGISQRTLDRWELGWTTRNAGKRRGGWLPKLQKVWKELDENDVDAGLLIKEVRIKTCADLATLLWRKIEQSAPNITPKSSADLRGLVSEFRELMKHIAQEKGELKPPPRTVIAVRADVDMKYLRERYARAKEIEAETVDADG